MNFPTPKSDNAKPPSETWRARAQRIVEHQMRGIAADIAADLLRSRWARLDERVAAAIARGAEDDIEQALIELDTGLLEAVRVARERGALKPPTNRVYESLPALEAHGKGAKEIENLDQIIRLPEQLVSVDFFKVTTTQRVITLDEIRAWGRPPSWRNDQTWIAQYVGDREVERLRDAAEQRANPRSLWADANESTR